MKRDSNLKIQGHNYAKFYDEYFFEKNKELNILEIGSFMVTPLLRYIFILRMPKYIQQIYFLIYLVILLIE